MDNWRESAECRHEDPDLFFPIGTSGPALLQTEQAKAVCRRCPVREACLDWAMNTDQTLGVWGGTSETERRAIKRRARARRGS
ncbi:WhiB family transcriptional regulator [Streptomyces antibioticus]|uniref:Transcriptional regulator WhiB n=1 Tax=Streptomyces antibioticus TaxID=1890 RepID=A0AAE6Y3D3_STRAT|nr:WhiB family transcriptional regulator [Streptomyces antibioticus]MCX4743407.1 WhiB family transcriptional regulator [Streptomyces antibioticus]MCX5166982.1 WhiB family transcriptional regulator [Streptomyces antibioticus]OOQ54957.1 transcription factor WhiB [Streptomyces antibioticus]QIT42603.1 WhiB family transcriptional regulator [Streptomyces antibioticus]